MPALKRRKIPRRIQIENIDKKSYFKRPEEKRRFITRRIVRGDVRTLQSKTILIDLYKLMKAKMQTKKQIRQSIKSSEQKIKKSQETIIGAIKKSNEKYTEILNKSGIRKGTVKDPKNTIEKYKAALKIEEQRRKRTEKKETKKIESFKEKLKITKKSQRISALKGRMGSVILNFGGNPIKFEVNERNLALIEEKLRPQTILDPREVAIRRILIKHPRRRTATIIKNLKAQGKNIDARFIAKVIRKMIDEKLIERDYPKLNNHVKK